MQSRAEQSCFSFRLSAGPPTKSKIYFKAQNKKLSKNNKNNKNLYFIMGRARGAGGATLLTTVLAAVDTLISFVSEPNLG